MGLSVPSEKIHIIGIGGIGMSGIAELLQHQGHVVQGSDQQRNANVIRLEQKGINVCIGHKPQDCADIDILVHSTAIKADNPEIVAARKAGIPVLTRAEILAQIMAPYSTIAVSGTHGKTTTTSLIAEALESLDPTVLNGGIINTYGSNIHIGQSQWMVVEADESDGTFVQIPATIAVITNIDPEHLDYYKTFDVLKAKFKQFIDQVPDDGFALLCSDHPIVRALSRLETDRKIVTYGLEANAQVQGNNLRAKKMGTVFDVHFQGHPKALMQDVFVPMYGKHNIQNTLAAIAIAHQLGVAPKKLRDSLLKFKGVQRRFTKRGDALGMDIIDDYAHHPTEIQAVLETARQVTTGKIIVVFQPHRFSRLQGLYKEFLESFKGADHLLLIPVFTAGEQAVRGVDSEIFCEDMAKAQQQDALYCKDFETVTKTVHAIGRPGDLLLFLGAGDITEWAKKTPNALSDKATSPCR